MPILTLCSFQFDVALATFVKLNVAGGLWLVDMRAINLFDLENWTTEGSKFTAFDRLPDARATGPQGLTRPDVARAVAAVLLPGITRDYMSLGSWVVMSNHVHMLLQSRFDLDPQLDRGATHNPLYRAEPWSRKVCAANAPSGHFRAQMQARDLLDSPAAVHHQNMADNHIGHRTAKK